MTTNNALNSPAPAINVVNVQVFPTSGTYTPSSGLVEAMVYAIGGGGSGGGSTNSSPSTASAGGGGGSGGTTQALLSAAQIGASQTVTIGAGGVGASGTSGTGGGTTSFGSLLTALGGGPGNATAGTAVSIVVFGGAGANAGTVSSGTAINVAPGSVGQYAYLDISGDGVSGSGGASTIGGGAFPVTGSAVNGNNGVANTGGGGSGAINFGSTGSMTGGNGGSGYVIVIEYCAQQAVSLVPGLGWNTITSNQSMVPSTGYFTNGSSQITLTLPTPFVVGQTFFVQNISSFGVKIAQNSGQSIIVGPNTTTSGTGGSLQSSNIGDAITLIACSTTQLAAQVGQGSWLVT